MKKLNNFIDKAPLWQIFIVGWFFSSVFIASNIYVFNLIEPSSTKLIISGINCIKIGIIMGILIGFMFMIMLSMGRESQIFWDYSKEVESLIDKAETKESLQSIFDNEFQDLREKCWGGPQIQELNRLYTIIKTKNKYINK